MEINRKNSFIVLGTITFAIVIYLGLSNLNHVASGISIVINLMMPFIIGCVIAFIFNVIMNFLE